MLRTIATLLRLLIVVTLMAGGPGIALAQQAGSSGAAAQSGEGPHALSESDLKEWEALADQAEELVNNDSASDAALTEVRGKLSYWRGRFDDAQSANSAAIQAVQAQLDTLGDPPAEGEPAESEAVADQRETLQSRLDELRAPARAAELYYAEADSLISSIDAIQRSRQADEFLELTPTPLNPATWPTALSDLTGYFEAIVTNVSGNWDDAGKRSEFRNNLPLILIMLVAAGVLVMRGVSWLESLANHFIGDDRSAQRWLLRFVVSLAQIVVPVSGLVLVSVAAARSGLFGAEGNALLHSLPAVGVLLYTARWLGHYVFPVSDNVDASVYLSTTQRREGRVYLITYGALMGILVMIKAAAEAADWPDQTSDVLVLPVLVVMALFMLRISRFIILMGQYTEDDGEEHGFRKQLVMVLGRVVFFAAILGPILAGIGYFTMGEALITRTGSSLMVIALLFILQRLIIEIYVLITRDRDGVKDALLPVLLGFLLTLCSLPIFALIWGARVTDLLELWTRFLQGFSVGGLTISPSNFIIFAVVFVAGYVVTRAVQGALKTSVLPKTKLDLGGRNAVVSGLGYVGIFLAALVAITMAGIDLSSLAIVAGALSVGVGFGLQTIVSNFVSGIILLIERPISEGDWIEVGGQMGFVRSISVRATRIETFDRTDVIVPNADLISGQVTNWTRGNLVGRLIVKVGVAYGTDTRRVHGILQEIAEEHPIIVLSPPPGVVFAGFGADSLDFEIRAILRDVTQIIDVQTELNHQIAERFAKENIEIPFGQRDIWLRNPEALAKAAIEARKDGAEQKTAPPAKPADSSHITRDDMHDGDDGEAEADPDAE
ncbi:DUF3772 domain-containing protein [Pseudooceanicola sp. HF7]|uniref:DUF3772 domain-containing protein n=1 Tax=Pseudooceanicola sp. HF7 TaxID=2721560 RepID=UPI0014304C7B|nr:DUF3772 domain-containing protein [Pseudooceanicola sp. HF7]NIZ08682.1 mechanosensitive ion channel family protein [Pseudooceanicola sp. HF7]